MIGNQNFSGGLYVRGTRRKLGFLGGRRRVGGEEGGIVTNGVRKAGQLGGERFLLRSIVHG